MVIHEVIGAGCWGCDKAEDVLKLDCDEDGIGGDDVADCLRYLVAPYHAQLPSTNFAASEIPFPSLNLNPRPSTVFSTARLNPQPFPPQIFGGDEVADGNAEEVEGV